ncbi:CBO0543 family protein [Bacillus suaedaesalsae]|uniref:CBO0543 family protein n=1 Tax=Bacillus suaedaesalsae TaxID=2810349 RepID=UPI001EF65F16|nr:CBO0543 family protein [Bacillus suaedaesalsae]
MGECWNLGDPVNILLFKIDRSRALHLGFFGYNVHVLSTYIDGYATNHGNWEYPFKAIPFLPISFGLDTSLIPVVYMLVYQWTLNHKKNYYIMLLLVSAVFSFVLKPILVSLDLFRFGDGQTYFHLFFWYFIGGVIAKWITNVFLYFEKSAKGTN